MKRVALFALVWFVFVGPWHESWIGSLDGSNYQSVADQRLKSIRQTSKSSPAGELRAGVAIKDITEISKGLPLAGYGARAFRSNTGVADNIAVKALVIDNGSNRIAFVTGDFLLVNRRLADGLMEELKARGSTWQRDRIFFGASHTHSGPGGFPYRTLETLGIGWSNDQFVRNLVTAMADAIESANQRLNKVEIKHIATVAPSECIRNRTRPSGPTNRHLDAIALRELGSKQWMASIVVFSAHATCHPSEDARLSGDYAGLLAKKIESHFGGTCLFFAGAVGGMGPGEIAPKPILAETLAAKLADCLRDAENDSQAAGWQSRITVEARRLSLPLPAPAVKISPQLRLSPILAGFLLPAEADVFGAQLGPVLLVGTPADYNGVLAAQMRSSTSTMTTIVTSFAGDYVGYVIEDGDYDLPKYEPRQMVFYGRKLGAYFHSSLIEFAKSFGQ